MASKVVKALQEPFGPEQDDFAVVAFSIGRVALPVVFYGWEFRLLMRSADI